MGLDPFIEIGMSALLAPARTMKADRPIALVILVSQNDGIDVSAHPKTNTELADNPFD